MVIRDDQIEAIAALPVYITSVILGSGKNKLNPLPDEKNISISYRQNQAQFEFTAPGFINEKQLLYSYRLSGSEDTAWSQPANVYSVYYASLQPGRYGFEARALGWDGNFGKSAAFNFIIRPPFWQTRWFIGICILTLGFLFYIFYRYRINQLLKIQQVRNRIATDLHDDIGSSLTNISLLSELSNKNIQNPQQARIFIERISEEVNSSGQALDDIVWSINAQNDSLEQMLARMRRYAAEIFDATGISYTLQMEEQFASRKLNMEQRRDVFLIYKEALNNIYKHAGAKEVRIKLHIEKKCLHLNIADDGKGFDTTATTHRNGLKNMQHRAAKWKGYIRVVSFLGKGTSIEMSMPLS